MKPYLLLLFPFLFAACTESSVGVISGPELFAENDFYISEINEENRAGVEEVDILWKEATFGRVTSEPVFRNTFWKKSNLKTVKPPIGLPPYRLTTVLTLPPNWKKQKMALSSVPCKLEKSALV